ncbi:MAG: penicillin-binding protein activator [Stenotrophomonas nitritireducens]|uniref:penicillin-binding protein activator n=1 Tax=Stenotrophomonas nitritireducens TaxID=83617 RepID=UPI001ACBFE51|nr:penicillin-binding protein activator [Stenotrophomonas nitritireducens]MBN8791356.1 penicillin-binding protein activator [Stenotrophomonas nitritireducens]MBN8795298.1 penicillin-binding protein activator [Stenotrophomonas nitritireducens]
MNKPAARITALSLSLLLFAGCATTGMAPTTSPAQQAAIALLEQGKPREAAQQLEAEAALVRGAAKSQLLADAAFAWHEAGDDARARMLLPQMQARQLAGASRQRHALLGAELALADKQPAAVLQALGTQPPDQLTAAQQARWHLARGQALEATGDAFAAAGARARAGVLLSGSARTDNQRSITRLLAGLDDATLASRSAALPAGDPLYNHAGRALIGRGLPLPRPFDRDAAWQLDTGKRPPAEADGYRPPVKMAVLLPLSGNLATAAAPVRDGLLAGYYAEYRRRPQVDFIDTRGTPAGAIAAYDKAVASGADFVVGPLGRDEVDALFGRDPLQVPLLALNRGKDTPPAGSAGFSLAPEDDGIMAAEYLLARERGNVLVIGSNDDTGRRATAAFRERFAERGGKVAASLSVGDAPGDVSARLRQAGTVDAVFLAVKGSQARVLAPQLALAGMGGATRVGTSQLASGTGKADEDMALDGIAFPSETWSVRGAPGLPAAGELATTLPTARGAAARLFAFGFDAWKISAYLEKLANSTQGGLAGATGTLHLDGFGNVLRTPAWSTFSGGQPVPIGDGR